MRKFMFVVAALLAALFLSACEDSGSDGHEAERDSARATQNHFASSQPPHMYDASQARENLIAAHDAMALGADSWTVSIIEGVGVNFECPSVGFPVPYGTNITNPSDILHFGGGSGTRRSVTVPMMEPYGLYPPADVPATYANCVLPNGEIGIFYSEPMLQTFLFDVVYDEELGRYVIPEYAETSVTVTRVEDVTITENNLDESVEDEDGDD